MLAERRRRIVGADALGVDLERQRERLHASELVDDSGGTRLLVRGRLGDVLHRRDGDPVEHFEPVRRRMLLEARADRRQERVPVREPVRIRAKARVLDKLRQPDALAEPREEPVVRGGNHQLAVLRRKHLVRRDEREGRAVAPRCVAGAERVRELVADEREAGLEERHVDLAAPARLRALEQRGHDPERRPHAGAEVDERRADPNAGPVALAGHAHDPGERLHERVVARLRRERPATPERADRAVDETLVSGAKRLRAEAEPVRGAGSHRLHEDVGAVDEPQQRLQTAGRLHVERERALRPVRGEEHHAASVEEPRPPGARLVAALRMLDLHDIRSERCQDLRARRAR